MKFELSDAEEKQLKRRVENNPIGKFLLAKDQLSFEIGDVLIRKVKHYDYQTSTHSWKIAPISSGNPMPQRYVFIHRDEFGIGYLKELKVSTGKLGRDIFCLSDYDIDSVQFEVDPEYAERIFLEADFDIKDLHKKSLENRKIITKMNHKTGRKLHSLKEYNEWFNNIKDGDQFWMSSDYTGRWIQQLTLVKKTPVTIQNLEKGSDWSWRHFKEKWKNNPSAGINDSFVLKLTIRESNSQHDRDTLVFDMGRDMVFYTQAPAKEDKK